MKMAETTFFNLPMELRKIIYKKSIFLFIRDKVKNKLAKHAKTHFLLQTPSSISHTMLLTPIKTMRIENHLWEAKHSDFIVVDVGIYSEITISLSIAEEPGKLVTLRIGTEQSTRNTALRMSSFDKSKQTSFEPLIQWFCSGFYQQKLLKHFNKNYIKT